MSIFGSNWKKKKVKEERAVREVALTLPQVESPPATTEVKEVWEEKYFDIFDLYWYNLDKETLAICYKARGKYFDCTTNKEVSESTPLFVESNSRRFKVCDKSIKIKNEKSVFPPVAGLYYNYNGYDPDFHECVYFLPMKISCKREETYAFEAGLTDFCAIAPKEGTKSEVKFGNASEYYENDYYLPKYLKPYNAKYILGQIYKGRICFPSYSTNNLEFGYYRLDKEDLTSIPAICLEFAGIKELESQMNFAYQKRLSDLNRQNEIEESCKRTQQKEFEKREKIASIIREKMIVTENFQQTNEPTSTEQENSLSL